MNNWNITYKLLEEYIKEYNKLPTHSIIYKNVRLGGWVGYQRHNYNKNKLSNDKINKLNTINNWVWKFNKINHKKNFEDEKNKLKLLYNKKGICALSYKWLSDNGYKKLYNNIVIGKGKYKIKLEDLAKEMNIYDEWKKQRHKLIVGKVRQQWTLEIFEQKTKEIIKKYGNVPAAEFLRTNGFRTYITYMYSKNIKMADLQKKYNFKKTKWISKNDMYWLSHAECCLANFLYSRGIEIKNGEKYPDEYSKLTGRKYGIYDLHFKCKIGEFVNNWISVEVWGDNPNGHGEIEYAKKRKGKELFNKNIKTFLGISYEDCYNEKSLENILKKYIGVIEPFVFKDERDALFQSTQWTIKDMVIKECKYILKHNNNILPPEGWFRLRKNGKYENRIINDWEKNLKINLNTLSVYIKQCGGIRKIRNLLSCDNDSTVKWDQSNIINNMKDIYKQYSLPVGVIETRLYRKINITNTEMLLKKKCCNIKNASNKHFKNGYKEACKIANIPIKIKWKKKLVI